MGRNSVFEDRAISGFHGSKYEVWSLLGCSHVEVDQRFGGSVHF
jgi:hypothetical protein